MKKLIALSFLLCSTAFATTQTVKQDRLRYALTKAHKSASQASILLAGVANVLYYDTYTELAAATPTEGTIGYAIDSNAFYLMAGSSWVPLNSTTSFTGAQGGTADNATNNVWKFGENSEDLTLTFASDLVTFASTTGALLTLTPATTITGDLTLNGGAGALTFGAASSSVVVPNNSATGLILGSSGLANLLTLDTRTGAEQLMITGSTGATAFNVAVGLANFAELVGIDGGAGALTFTSSDASIIVKDNDSTALNIGSAGTTTLMSLDTRNNQEKVTISGYTGLPSLSVAVGNASFTEGVVTPKAAMAYDKIRFCGNGANGNTENYLKPVMESDYGTDMSYGAAGCDGNDSTTLTTADLAWSVMTYYPMSMVCTITGAGGSDDLVAFQLYDDTAAISGMTCSVTLAGTDQKQCVVRDVTSAAIAGSSQITVGVVGVDDNCSGCDMECHVYVNY